MVPDIPESLDIKIKRERYLAKQALADAEQLLQQVSSFATDWRIKRMDLTPRGDIIVAVEETYVASAIIEA